MTIRLTDDLDDYEGSEKGDIIYGLAGDDTIYGLGGNDRIYGGPGRDTLYGGDGNDYLEAGVAGSGGSPDKLYGEAGDDTLRPGDGIYADFYGGDGNDDIIGTSGLVEGGAGADKLRSGKGGSGTSILSYEESNAAVTINLAKSTAGGGHATGDTIIGFQNAWGSRFDDTISGTSEINFLSGRDGNDVLKGLGGNDTLNGGAGRDKLIGGDGDDTLEGGAGGDVIDGGKGIDTASYHSSRAGVKVSLVSGRGSGGDAAGDTLKSIENLAGSDHDDELIGDGKDNDLRGNDGADILRGGGGNDTLTGGDLITRGGHADRIFGEAGDDTIYADPGADVIDGGAGFDTVRYGYTFDELVIFMNGRPGKGGDAEGDVLRNVEAVVVEAAKATVTGSGKADHIRTGRGDDVLKGGGGNDVLEGGAGADTLDGGGGSDTADYSGNFSGSLTINLANGRTKGGHAEGDRLISIENVKGGFDNDTLTGDKGANVLDGYFGDDVLSGQGGNDTLIGGYGSDKLDGGAGDDRLDGGSGRDVLTGGKGRDVFVFTQLTDSGITAQTRDLIKDFKPKQDKIDLSAIDAKTGGKKPKDDKFSFILKQQFSKTKGELRFEQKGKKTFIYGDVDGDAKADFSIELAGKIDLKGTDFVL